MNLIFERNSLAERRVKVRTYRVRIGRRWGVKTREWTRIRSSNTPPMWLTRFPKGRTLD